MLRQLREEYKEHPGSLVDLDTPPASVADPCAPSTKSTSHGTCIQELEEGEYASSEEMETTEEFLSEEPDGCDSPIYRPPSLSPTLQLEEDRPEGHDQTDLQRD